LRNTVTDGDSNCNIHWNSLTDRDIYVDTHSHRNTFMYTEL